MAGCDAKAALDTRTLATSAVGLQAARRCGLQPWRVGQRWTAVDSGGHSRVPLPCAADCPCIRRRRPIAAIRQTHHRALDIVLCPGAPHTHNSATARVQTPWRPSSSTAACPLPLQPRRRSCSCLSCPPMSRRCSMPPTPRGALPALVPLLRGSPSDLLARTGSQSNPAPPAATGLHMRCSVPPTRPSTCARSRHRIRFSSRSPSTSTPMATTFPSRPHAP